MQPQVVLVDPAAADWASAVLASMPPETRPAVVALGPSGASLAALSDDWCINAQELSARLPVALVRARARRRAQSRAMSDTLTLLPNRRAAIAALLRSSARAAREGTTFSVALIDLDHFKRINTELGHAEGDRLLRRVGLALRSATRGSEVLARIGGDEFGLIVNGDQSAARAASERIHQALRQEGVAGTIVHAELQPHEGLRALYKRLTMLLREAKAQRPSRPGSSAQIRVGVAQAAPVRAHRAR
jgi:diguanylate cyclase (GGDEF)-like protein